MLFKWKSKKTKKTKQEASPSAQAGALREGFSNNKGK
jgi:hypothetical protein